MKSCALLVVAASLPAATSFTPHSTSRPLSSSNGFSFLLLVESPSSLRGSVQDSSNGNIDVPEMSSEQLLQKLPLLGDILQEDGELIESIGVSLETVEVMPGEVIVAEGDVWSSAYFVIDGELECTSISSAPDHEDVRKRRFVPGDSFGEVALVSKDRVSGVEVRSGLSSASTLLRLRGEVFDSLVDDGTFTILLFKYLISKVSRDTATPPTWFLAAVASRMLASCIQSGASTSGENDIIYAISHVYPSILHWTSPVV